MKLKKCQVCDSYTLKAEHCEKPVKEAHYKYIKIRNAKRESSEIVHA